MTQEELKMVLDALKEAQTNDDGMEKWDRNKKAIAAIEEALAQTELCKYGQEPASCTSNPMDCQCAIDASLAQTQEPFAWAEFDGEGSYFLRLYENNETYAEDWNKRNPNHIGWVEPIYKHLPQRTWVGLTDKEITALFGPFPKYPSEWDDPDFYRLTQAIEAKLKQKNGYSEENT